jgi:hypothetical protein
MTTLGVLKARIADDLARTDLTSQIASAIADAIDEYKAERLGFNETVSAALDFVAGTASYAVPTDFLKLDRMEHRDTSGDTTLDQISYADYQAWTHSAANDQGQPSRFAIYDDKFFFWPTPDSSSDDYVVSYLQDLGVPATDDATNAWMVAGRNLIRVRAKADLYMHVIRDQQEAAVCYAEAANQLARLKKQAARARGPRRVRARWC